MSATELYYFPGQKATVFLETLNAVDIRADGYTSPDGYPVIDRVIFPDLSLAANFPKNMVKLDVGLYFFQFTLPIGAAAVGSYLVDGHYNIPLGTSITLASSGNTIITVISNGATLPQNIINVVSTTNFPTSGSIFVTTSAGVQTVTYTGKSASTFTGCTGGTGIMSTGGSVINILATLPQAIINVGSTEGFPTSGSVSIITNAGVQLITYTGITGTTLTGASGGSSIMSIGNTITSVRYYTKLWQILVTAPFGNFSTTAF